MVKIQIHGTCSFTLHGRVPDINFNIIVDNCRLKSNFYILSGSFSLPGCFGAPYNLLRFITIINYLNRQETLNHAES